jgi:hypothetical protein
MLTTGMKTQLCRSLVQEGNGLTSVREPVAASVGEAIDEDFEAREQVLRELEQRLRA